jgi:hypothetical protein
MLCYSCSKQKDELHPYQSAILDGVNLFMCQSCIDGKYEPRWVIILAGRQKGADVVRDYIIKRRYFGRPISAEEIIA